MQMLYNHINISEHLAGTFSDCLSGYPNVAAINDNHPQQQTRMQPMEH